MRRSPMIPMVAARACWAASLFTLLTSCGSQVQSPVPMLTSVAPPVVCGSQITTAVSITGSGLVPLHVDALLETPHAILPQIYLTQKMLLDGSPGSGRETHLYDGADALRVRWQSTQQLTFDVYPGLVGFNPSQGMAGTDLEPGLYHVTVQNPDGQRAALDGALSVVEPPVLQRVQPVPSCNAQGEATFDLTGQNFLRLGSDLPLVTFVSRTDPQIMTQRVASSMSGCKMLFAPMGVSLEACTSLVVAVPQDTLAPGDYDVQVQNPGSAGCKSQPSTGDDTTRAVLIPPPTVTSATTVAVCGAATSTIDVVGTDFVVLDSPAATPSAELSGAGQTRTYASVVDPASCQPVTASSSAQRCTALRITIPGGDLPLGRYSLTLHNPGQNACQIATPLTVDVVGSPTLSSVSPATLCTGGGTINLVGTNIYAGAAAKINQVSSTNLTVNAGATQAQAQFAGPIPLTVAGMLDDVTLENAPGCSAKLTAAIAINPGPAILFVDPPTVPAVTTIRATLYASGISGQIKQVQIFPRGGQTPILTFTSTTIPALSLDPIFPNRAYLTLNLGALPEGTYDVALSDTMSVCTAFLASALKVVATPTLTVTKATPAFGSPTQDTPLTITGTGFAAVPRAYLSGGGGSAQSLAAVTFTSATSLNAVARQGLTPGLYDLIVVNPNGTFGIARGAFTVTTAAAPPPVITSLSPASIVQGSPSGVQVLGSGFRTGAAIALTCFNSSNVLVAGATASVTNIAGSGQALTASFSAPNGSTYCLVRITNQDNTSFEYSAVGVTNSSLNLSGFKAGANMTAPRRALAAVAGRPTAVARYVYALGGDNGQDAMPRASVEAAATGLDGQLGTFAVLSQQLPKTLSFLSATVIGRFIYAVGGFDGAAASRNVYRAEILSPLNAPQFSDVNLALSQTVGLGQGTYVYRIAAVMGAGDASNPSGETLAGDFFPIQLPQLTTGRLVVQLFWPGVPGAQSYRIYRSPAVNTAAGGEKLLAVVAHNAGMTTQTYSDNGTVVPSGASPLPIGSTGSWATLPSLATARIGAAVGVAQHPTNPAQWFLYAVGGNSGTIAAPTPLDTGEFLMITVNNAGNVQTQTTGGAFAATTGKLSKPRWLTAGLPATSANNSVVMPVGTTYFFAASGSTTSLTTLERIVETAQSQADGQLPSFASAGTVGIARPGYGGVLVNNQMLAFGGFQGGNASTASDSANLTSSTTLSNFNNLAGGSLLSPRALQGTAVESAFIYQLGGASAGVNTAQATTEQTIW